MWSTSDRTTGYVYGERNVVGEDVYKCGRIELCEGGCVGEYVRV